MSASPAFPVRAQALAALVVFLGIAVGVFCFSAPRRVIELHSAHPFWIASIEGTAGDRVQVWIWTAGPTRLTEIRVPAVLQLTRSDLLLQVRSLGGHRFRLAVRRADGSGSADASVEEGSTNSVAFVSSVNRIPFRSGDEFSAHPFNGSVPLGLRPLYSPAWHTHHTGFGLVEPLPPPSP